MKTKNKINQLETRLSEVERELNTLLWTLTKDLQEDECTLTYEEVIDQWLNGKEQ